MQSYRKCGVWLLIALLQIWPDYIQAQQTPKLTTVNYGNIVITAANWPFLIAE